MGIFKKKINKFDYQPRYYKGDNPYKFDHKFDEFRTTVNTDRSLKGKFVNAIDEFKDSENGGVNKTILIIICILVLIFLFIIDFDLSIFLGN
ncbi:hypothetical protein OD91_0356 [Lutibacter sp. Hel_I_33_5]|uniref:riboflavin synthase subunit beta n=1 Tax=Lutibacter sp. Hel_I_33_5 TaxID=1566289 RepID=UPI0011A13457|nr:riboflavin synthase subunit beta [Lutibacter sp. Hel_I_33_5]TVZ55114.1 hypothetical protein OD91_0356 [Lutibacter sp. Hel_I_33_5]